MKNQSNFTEGKILLPLLKFSFPVLLALLLQAMYGAVDMIIVGKFAHTADISAVATGSMLMQSITCVITGLSMGITVILGQQIGASHKEEAGKVVGSGIWLFAILTLALTLGITLFTDPLCALMQAPQDAFAPTVDYVFICGLGTVFIVAFNVLGSVFRGLGDSKMPLITVAIACVVNVAGDLLLVAALDMGAAGAAIATVAAQGVSVLISLLVIRRRGVPFPFSLRDIRMHPAFSKKILGIGIPMALQDLLVSLSFLVILAIINALGLTASAGVGVAEKICMFIMLIPSAYMQSMSAFVAQNVGAGKPHRARKALLYGILTSLVAGIITGYLSFFHGDMLCRIFADDPQVIAAGFSYLKSYGIDCLLTVFLFCFIGFFSGTGNSVFVMTQGLTGAFLVRIPISFLISRIPDVPLFYIGLATPCSTLVQIVMCVLFFLYQRRKKRI